MSNSTSGSSASGSSASASQPLNAIDVTAAYLGDVGDAASGSNGSSAARQMAALALSSAANNRAATAKAAAPKPTSSAFGDPLAGVPAASAVAAASSSKAAAAVKGLDDDANASVTLKLVSGDKKEFVVERKHAFISTLVKTALESDDKVEEVDVPGVTGAVLELVVTYMKEHKGVEPPIIEKPLKSKVMKDVCPHKSDAEYIDKIGQTRQMLYDLILAANYMDIKSLLHLGCAKVASLIKGQPLEKIKEILDPNPGSAGDAKNKDKDGKATKAGAAGTASASAASGGGSGYGSASVAAAAAAAPVPTATVPAVVTTAAAAAAAPSASASSVPAAMSDK